MISQAHGMAIFDLAELGSQSEHGAVSTFPKAQKYIQASPNQPSTILPPTLATAPTSLRREAQTSQPATPVQTLGLCPTREWSRHRPDKRANTQQNLAFIQLSIKRGAAGIALSQRSAAKRTADIVARDMSMPHQPRRWA